MLATYQPNQLIGDSSHQDYYWDAQLNQDIQSLESKAIYSKTRLAQMWGVHRNTVRKWAEVAVNAPGFHNGFSQVQRLATCPHCQHENHLNDLQYLHLKRNWMIECSSCGSNYKTEPRLLEVTDLNQRVPGRYAKILRIVGWLIDVYEVNQTKQILTTSTTERDKRLRSAIRKILNSQFTAA